MAQLSTGRGRGVWAVIERLRREEPGFASPPSGNGNGSSNGDSAYAGAVTPQAGIDVGSLRTLAVQGNKVYQWIADFDRGTVTESQFADFREAAEAWIIAASSGVEDSAGSGGYDPSSDGSEEDPDFADPSESDDDAAW